MRHHRQTSPQTKAIAAYSGPKPGASQALAKATGAKVASALKANAPSKLQADGRTFHVEQYRAASLLLKQYRADVKTPEQDTWVDAMAVAMAAVFEADSKQFGVPFSASYFVAGTK